MLIPDDIKKKYAEKRLKRKKKDNLQNKDNNIKEKQKLKNKIRSKTETKTKIETKTETKTDTEPEPKFIKICNKYIPIELIDDIIDNGYSNICKIAEYFLEVDSDNLCASNKILTPFRQENFFYEELIIIKTFNQDTMDCFEQLIKQIYYLDENRNFCIPNSKFPIIEYINHNYNISQFNKDEFIDKIILNIRDYYIIFLDKYKDKINSKYLDEHNMFVKYIPLDYNRIVSDFDDETELPSIDYKKIAKEKVLEYLRNNSKYNSKLMTEHNSIIIKIINKINDIQNFRLMSKINIENDNEDDNRIIINNKHITLVDKTININLNLNVINNKELSPFIITSIKEINDKSYAVLEDILPKLLSINKTNKNNKLVYDYSNIPSQKLLEIYQKHTDTQQTNTGEEQKQIIKEQQIDNEEDQKINLTLNICL
jgi:hypothetical protein